MHHHKKYILCGEHLDSYFKFQFPTIKSSSKVFAFQEQILRLNVFIFYIRYPIPSRIRDLLVYTATARDGQGFFKH